MICLSSGVLKLMNCLTAASSTGLLFGTKERETERNPGEDNLCSSSSGGICLSRLHGMEGHWSYRTETVRVQMERHEKIKWQDLWSLGLGWSMFSPWSVAPLRPFAPGTHSGDVLTWAGDTAWPAAHCSKCHVGHPEQGWKSQQLPPG